VASAAWSAATHETCAATSKRTAHTSLAPHRGANGKMTGKDVVRAIKQRKIDSE